MLDLITDPIRTHINDITLGLVATSLVVFGDDINNMLRSLLKKQHLLLRLIAFILLCSLGYSALAVSLTPLLKQLLLSLNDWQLLTFVIGSFLILALIAQKQRRV